ncbi:MAG TPA: hypothetical protein PKX40_08450 [Spirochaetota bacterium]|jgi:hypothetical protein|nr:hypothetical protein [Spirochaetota bacterium]
MVEMKKYLYLSILSRTSIISWPITRYPVLMERFSPRRLITMRGGNITAAIVFHARCAVMNAAKHALREIPVKNQEIDPAMALQAIALQNPQN